MTAGTVVITGGILATVILLCIIAVLCYCRLQVFDIWGIWGVRVLVARDFHIFTLGFVWNQLVDSSPEMLQRFGCRF